MSLRRINNKNIIRSYLPTFCRHMPLQDNFGHNYG